MELPPALTRSPVGEDVLGQIETAGVFHATTRLSEPWGIEMPPLPQVVVYHLLTAGRATVEVGETTIELVPGNLLVVPRGTGHRILSSTGAAPTPLHRIERDRIGARYERLVLQGGGEPAGLVCGAVRFTDLAVSRLVAELPPALLLPSSATWTRTLIEMIAQESEHPAPGSDVVTARLADVLLVRAVRAWWSEAAAEHGWLAVVRDPVLGPALRAFHAAPEQDWGLVRLAAVAGVSRSAFAARFTELAGTSAMAYVCEWRMDLVARLLGESALTVAAVARRVGYSSVPGFTRAFHRRHGRPPGTWRTDPPDELAAVVASLESGAA